MPVLRVVLSLALLAGVQAECPNACSGHGTCSLHDQCTCCRDYTGSDCSERVCQFGYAHVDSPKGDLDGSTGTLSGPQATLIKGSNMYPYGTSEQFPNTASDEGHFYMECSNKGLCNREDGTCECFAGYEGSACQRASCPNECSGHGTCETIKELAEDKEDGDLSTGAYGEQGYAAYTAGLGDLSAFGKLKYELWDKTMTMGCKCDPGFTGPDCSLKLCRYGVDPLFIPSSHMYSQADPNNLNANRGIDSWAIIDDDGLSESAPMYEQSFVEIVTYDTLAEDSPNQAALDPSQMSGSFDLIVYDVYGEKYTLDKLHYAHYDEKVITHGWQGFGTPYGGNYGHNHTSCEEIMAYFPNDKLKDTTMGSWQNQMQHKGGLVSTAYVTGSTKPFCSVTSPKGQNTTLVDDSTTRGYTGPAHTETYAAPTNCGDISATVAVSDTTITLGTGCTTANGPDVAKGDTIYVLPAADVNPAGAGANGAVDGNGEYMRIVSLDSSDPRVATVIRAGFDANGLQHTAKAFAASDLVFIVSRTVTQTWGIRYNFDYNRGNPGYHKDLYIENLIPSPGMNIPVRGFYGTIKQGMVAEIRGDKADDRRSKTYDVTLPGYVMDATEGGSTILFSEDLSAYLAGTDEVINQGNIPDHKTSHISMLGYYYEIKSTERVIVDIDAAVPTYSDYMIGERDITTNATISTFATLATLATADTQDTTYANVLGATPDDEDNGRGGCSLTDATIALPPISETQTGGGNTHKCGNTNLKMSLILTSRSASTSDSGANFNQGATLNAGTNVAGDVMDLTVDDATVFSRGDAIQTTNAEEIMYVLGTEYSDGTTVTIKVMRGASNTAIEDTADAGDIFILNNDHGDAGTTNGGAAFTDGAGGAATASELAAAQLILSNYKNKISFFHSTEGLNQHFCMNGYIEKIEGGNYKCKTMTATANDLPTTDVSGEVRVPVKAKLSQPYQYVSECSNRGSCDRETGLCRCYTGYTHDNCDTQTPVC